MLRKACENNFLRGFSTDEASARDRQRRISPEHPKKISFSLRIRPPLISPRHWEGPWQWEQ